MKKRLLMVAFALFTVATTFAFKAGDYAWNTTQMFKITGDNLVTNGNFASGLDGWYGADRESTPSADVWSITEGAGPAGEKVVESLGATEGLSLCNSWTLEAGTYVVSYDLKYSAAGYTTILTAGAVAVNNAIDFFLNGDGNFTKLASSDEAPVVNVAYQTNFAAEEWNTIVYYFSAEQGQQLVMHAEKLATGMQITNLEIHAATQVYDRRIAQNRIAFVKQLMEMPEFNIDAAQDAKANLQGIIETIEGMIESGEIDDQSNAEALMQGLEEEGVQPFMSISSRLMNDKLAGTVDLPSLAEVKRGGNLPAAFANLSLQGGSWGHPANQNYMMSAIQTGYDHTATYNVFNTNFPKGRYLFTAEIRNANTDKTSWPCNPTYNAETVCKVFVGTDSIETAPIAGETFQRVTHVADIAEDGAFRAGVYWPGVGKGGAFFIQNVEVYALGDGQEISDKIDHIEAWTAFKAQWDAATSNRNAVAEKVGNNMFRWEQDSLLKAQAQWEPYYNDIVVKGWVAADGSDGGVATTDELTEWTTHQGFYPTVAEGEDSTFYKRYIQYAVVRGFGDASTYVTNANKPIADLKAAIAKHSAYLNNPRNVSCNQSLYTPVIAAAQAVLDDVNANSTDATRAADEARISEQMEAMDAAKAAFDASGSLTPIIDIDFTNPAEEGEEVAYLINGAKGQMTFSAFDMEDNNAGTNFAVGVGEECPGILRVGNGSAIVAIPEEDQPSENDIIEVKFDMWLGNLISKNFYVDLRNADDKRIAGFSICRYSGTLAYNDFNNAENTGLDLLAKASGLGSSSVSNAGICVDSNKSSVTLIVDRKGVSAQASIDNGKNGSLDGVAVALPGDLEDTKVAKVVVGSNYNNKDRRCWFDNLKVYKYPSIAAGPVGIEEVGVAAKAAADNAIYTLSGVKVAKASKPGMYIQKGKVFVVK